MRYILIKFFIKGGKGEMRRFLSRETLGDIWTQLETSSQKFLDGYSWKPLNHNYV
jgi:hypothetical protein